MNRRKFIKRLIGVTAFTAIPKEVVALIDTAKFTNCGNVTFHWDTQTISINDSENHKKGVSLIDLYTYLKKQWRDDEEFRKYHFPIQAIDRKNFSMEGGWKLSNDSLCHLRNGTIINGDEIYTGIVTLGELNGQE